VLNTPTRIPEAFRIASSRLQFSGRIAVKGGGHLGQGRSALRHDDQRYPGREPCGFLLDHQGRGSPVQSLIDKAMTILAVPGNGHKKPAGNYFPGIIGDPRDFPVEGPSHRQ
jgi:hypothetical protein